MPGFEKIDISGDAGIRAYGGDLGELFVNAAAGMYDLITDTAGFGATHSARVSAENMSLDSLMVAWLNELIYLFETDGLVAKHITDLDIRSPGDGDTAENSFRLTAVLHGEEFDPTRHEQRLLIKAATYHRLVLVREERSWKAEIIFDI